MSTSPFLNFLLYSYHFSTDSWDSLNSSILNRINAVRDAYGAGDWNHYVSVLAKEVDLSDASLLGVETIYAHAFYLIEPNLDFCLISLDFVTPGMLFIGWKDSSKSEEVKSKEVTHKNKSVLPFIGNNYQMSKSILNTNGIIIQRSSIYKEFLKGIDLYGNKRSKLTCALSAAALLKAMAEKREQKSNLTKIKGS